MLVQCTNRKLLRRLISLYTHHISCSIFLCCYCISCFTRSFSSPISVPFWIAWYHSLMSFAPSIVKDVKSNVKTEMAKLSAPGKTAKKDDLAELDLQRIM